MINIGIIREGKVPPDTRVPFSPKELKAIQNTHPDISIEIQSAISRCYSDNEYKQEGFELCEHIQDSDILFGVKEVKIEELIEGKTYFFFSHTKKKQAYNQKLMYALIDKKIRMIDYEALVDENGDRIIGFGYYAGVVGAHNGLLTYGRKHNLYSLVPAHQCKDYEDMIAQYSSIDLPNVKIAVTGSGRVAKGIWNIMEAAGVKEVSVDDYINNNYDEAVWVRLQPKDLYIHKVNSNYDRVDFHHHPEEYKCLFHKFIPHTDILMNGIYWSDSIERLFEKEDIKKDEFRISVISDITCDIDGSVPINTGATTIANPVYGINRNTLEQVEPYQNNKDIIDVMAVDNLPNELARDASKHFGERLNEIIIPELFKDKSDILDRATICQEGRLTNYFEYLSDYAYKK